MTSPADTPFREKSDEGLRRYREGELNLASEVYTMIESGWSIDRIKMFLVTRTDALRDRLEGMEVEVDKLPGITWLRRRSEERKMETSE